MKIRRRAKFSAAAVLLSLILLLCVGHGVYRGDILLNHPSRSRYPIRGVDVSHYQGEIDWRQLSQEDIHFAYIKATEGSGHQDETFLDNWEAARETSLKIGAYHFFSFDSPGETQAANFISTVEEVEGMLPPVVDVEFYGDKKANPPEAGKVREQLDRMLTLLQEHYQMMPVLYATEEAWELYLKDGYEDYPLWIRNVVRSP